MNKAAWIRLSVWVFILVLTIFASWYFYLISNINDDYDFYEHVFEHISRNEITQELDEYDVLKFLAEFEDIKKRLSPDGGIDRMVQGLRDYRDSITREDNEWFETPKNIRADLKALYAFKMAVYEHILITDTQIIGWENLSQQELTDIRAEIEPHGHFFQWRTLNWTIPPIYKGDIKNLFWVFDIEREIIGYTEQDLNDISDDYIIISPENWLGEPIYAENDYFDALKNINFTEFTQTAKDYDPARRELNYYFTINTESGRGLTIGDMSGTEWVVRSEFRPNRYNTFFMPVDWERVDFIDSAGAGDLANLSLLYSSFLENEHIPYPSAVILINAMRLICEDMQGEEIRLDFNEFSRRAEYTFGISGLEKETFSNTALLRGDEVYIHPEILNNSRTLAASLVSEDITDDSAVITLDFYRRNCYYELAKTVRYEFELGTHGWQLISAETLLGIDGAVLAYR